MQKLETTSDCVCVQIWPKVSSGYFATRPYFASLVASNDISNVAMLNQANRNSDQTLWVCYSLQTPEWSASLHLKLYKHNGHYYPNIRCWFVDSRWVRHFGCCHLGFKEPEATIFWQIWMWLIRWGDAIPLHICVTLSPKKFKWVNYIIIKFTPNIMKGWIRETRL